MRPNGKGEGRFIWTQLANIDELWTVLLFLLSFHTVSADRTVEGKHNRHEFLRMLPLPHAYPNTPKHGCAVIDGPSVVTLSTAREIASDAVLSGPQFAPNATFLLTDSIDCK